MIKRSKSSRRKRNKSVAASINYVNVVIFAVIGGLVVLGLLFLGRRFSDQLLNDDLAADELDPEVSDRLDTILPSLAPTVTPTTAPTLTPSPTPEPVSNPSDFRTQVLNGNGRVGGAQEGKNLLETNGFVVEAVGNASRWDYAKTEIRGSSSVPKAMLDQAAEALSGIYVVKIIEASDDTNGFDILVVLGRETP